MRDRRIDASRAIGEAKARGERALDAALLKCFDTRFWDIMREGLAFHRELPRLPQAATGKTKRRPGDNLLRRLHQFKDDVLRFLVDFDVPFSNSLAEQALRMCAGENQNLWRFQNFRRCSRLRRAPLRHRQRQITGLEHAPCRTRDPCTFAFQRFSLAVCRRASADVTDCRGGASRRHGQDYLGLPIIATDLCLFFFSPYSPSNAGGPCASSDHWEPRRQSGVRAWRSRMGVWDRLTGGLRRRNRRGRRPEGTDAGRRHCRGEPPASRRSAPSASLHAGSRLAPER